MKENDKDAALLCKWERDVLCRWALKLVHEPRQKPMEMVPSGVILKAFLSH